MKTGLIGKPQTTLRAALKRSFGPINASKPDSPCGFELLLEVTTAAVIRREQKQVDPCKAAVDVLVGGDLLDPVDRRFLALQVLARRIFAVRADHLVIEIVDRVGQVRARAGGHSPTDRTPVHDCNLVALECQFIRGG
jgi:hypothetical protein